MPTGFYYAGNMDGTNKPIVKKLYIPTATAIEKGEPVQFTQGTGVVVHAGPTK